MLERILGTLGILLIVLMIVRLKMRKGARGNERRMTDFREAERVANSARRKEIEPSLFFTPDLSAVPLPMDGSKAGEKVRARAAEKMVRFPGRVTNLELKMTYGPSQLELIAEYEENFHRYQSALIELAEKYMLEGKNAEALRALEYTVELGSEYRKSYLLAAGLYAEARDTDKLTALLETAEARTFTDESVKRSVVRHIMDTREALNV